AAIADLYLDSIRSGLANSEVFLIGDGEEAKSLSTVEGLCRNFAEFGLLRGDVVVALGGGVVGDTAGFAASVYYRGVDVLQVPTSLLAQVDAAIGGKTAVNIPEGKNLIGAFHQPIAVVSDTDTLASLSPREYRSGLGEIAKYALISDNESSGTGLIELLNDSTNLVLERDPAALADLVAMCSGIKAQVVAADPFERTGIRATLNLGHTLAHALETRGGYELTHGEAVSIGLIFAVELAEAAGRISSETAKRYCSVASSLGLPLEVPGGSEVNAEDLLAIMRRDKKASGGLTFVLPGKDGLQLVEDPPTDALAHAFRVVGVAG
ncbi:MAG: iron-containing alcohol dehydrogenase, partial [Actinobacteria bacterium]|nr:iron-containing alcohol dehydrogenase [Actinomycetota bacterium]